MPMCALCHSETAMLEYRQCVDTQACLDRLREAARRDGISMPRKIKPETKIKPKPIKPRPKWDAMAALYYSGKSREDARTQYPDSQYRNLCKVYNSLERARRDGESLTELESRMDAERQETIEQRQREITEYDAERAAGKAERDRIKVEKMAMFQALMARERERVKQRENEKWLSPLREQQRERLLWKLHSEDAEARAFRRYVRAGIAAQDAECNERRKIAKVKALILDMEQAAIGRRVSRGMIVSGEPLSENG